MDVNPGHIYVGVRTMMLIQKTSYNDESYSQLYWGDSCEMTLCMNHRLDVSVVLDVHSVFTLPIRVLSAKQLGLAIMTRVWQFAQFQSNSRFAQAFASL
jgi:hypothetical protein